MVTKHAPTRTAATLAELVDTALADEWDDECPVLALLQPLDAGSNKVDLAIKRIEHDPAHEVRAFGPDHECLAVCLSRLEAAGSSGPAVVAGPWPVRVTVAIDPHGEVTLVRHRNGRTERPASSDGPCAQLLRRTLTTLRLCA